MGIKISNEQFVEQLNLVRPTIIPLSEYHGVDNKIKCKCSVCNDEFETTPYVLLHGKSGNGCRKCAGTKKKTHEEYIQELSNKGILVDVIEKYNGYNHKILHKCKKCEYEWKAKPSNILYGNLCPVCANKIVLKGYNDLWSTHPSIAKLLDNPDDGYTVVSGSGKSLLWKCPRCGQATKKIVRNVVRNNGFSCKMCSDGVSYPMKFVISVLNQLNVEFETEQTFNWCTFIMNEKMHTGRYDIVLRQNHIDYIVEVDGAFHNRDNPMSGQTKEESQFIDREKDRLAKENGFQIIRIPALKSTQDYMRESIYKSFINSLFDLSNIDWDKANVDALSSRIIESAKLWNLYHNAHRISDLLGIRQEVVTRYLKKATKAGLCNYDGKEEQRKSGRRQGLINARNNFAYMN